jgi:diguanylate cyclase (GGDEF)-like protein
VLILVLNAEEERQALARVELADRMVRMLSRVGIALSMHQNLGPLCTEAVHQIASSSELAAVLLWTKDSDSELLTLMASVGVNRQGIGVVQTLSPQVGSTCVAEIAAATRQPIHLRSVQSSIMTSELEAKFCYLRPGGVSVVPLVIGDKLIGVLELVGKDGDLSFGESQSLFRTVAEQLALALNSAMLFESLERLATFDPLTGIANHRAMQEFLHQRIAEAKRMGTEVAVLMIDVDHFRSFNEDEGHDAGDDVLRKVAEILSMAVRPYDLAARYGGEEFTIIMPDIHAEAALAAAERIRQRVEQTTCTFKSGRSRSITASVGYAMFPHAATEPGDVLKAADVALFHAKATGRNRVVMYSHELNQPEHGLQRLDSSSWILPELLAESHALQSEVESRLSGLAERLQLGISQQQMLLNLAVLAPTYLFAVRHGLRSVIDEMHAAPELRPLLPAFSGLTDRFEDEGKGQRIPLLARIVLVIRALTTGEGWEDPGLLDPELVEIIDSLPRAA